MDMISTDFGSDPAAAGFDPARLAAIDDMLLRLVRSRRLPGAVTMVMRSGVLASCSAVGLQDPAGGAAMRPDSIFRIHSMTKPIVSVALMMLVEQGRLLLSDPVSKHLSEFASTQVQVETAGGPRRAAPAAAMTVHDLLRHTAGLTYEFLAPAPVRTLYAEAGVSTRKRSNAEHARALAELPLMHEPGRVWDYSRATDVVGRLVEVVAGNTLGAHLQAVIFDPLGMIDTGFHVPADDQHRIAEPYAIDPDTDARVVLSDMRSAAALESGGGGLASTAPDYLRFLQMLLNRGRLGGVRLLGRKTVEYMTSDHLGAIASVCDLLPPGHGFGLGFAVRLATGIAAIPGSIGTYGWGGIGGTLFFVDPREEMIALMMIQAPGQREEIQQLFRTMVYAALDG